jgi:DNA-binding NtrC family response regulator
MSAGKGTVLVLDDEPSLRLLVRVNLELEGYRVVEARTLAEAREALAAEAVDVALLDVHVGSDVGLDLLPDLRAQDPPASAIVLSGTAEVTPEMREQVDDVLGKPFTLDALSAAVGRQALR